MYVEVTQYTLNPCQRILKVKWSYRAATHPTHFQFFGPFVLLTRLPPLKVAFPAEEHGVKIDQIITASACLPPPGLHGKKISWVQDDSLPEDEVELPGIYKEYLGLKRSDVVMFSSQESSEAAEVVVACVGESSLPFKAKYLPSIVWNGQVFPVITEKADHAVYGGLFSNFAYWKVTSINKGTDKTSGYLITKSTRVLQAADLYERLLPNIIRTSVGLGCTLKIRSLLQRTNSLSRLMKCNQVGQSVFISGAQGSGKRTLVRLSADRAGLYVLEISGFDLSSLQDLEHYFEKSKNCILHIRHFVEAWNLLNWGQTTDVLLRKCLELISQSSFVIFSSSEPINSLPGPLRNTFNLTLELSAPDESTRAEVLAELNPDLVPYARDLAGRSLEDLATFARKVRSGSSPEALLRRAGSLVPNVRWEDVGGLMHAKQDIMDTVLLPLQQPELFAGLQPRSGLLLYGPPGTGKTLLAKAVATECSLNFVAVKGPEMLSMYVGDSEKNIRDLFRRCRETSPCILFFDELDSLAPARGASADSGKVMERVVAQLLTELDGVRKSTGLFVIAATNRPDLLDPALLRPGRFDKSVFVDVCRDRPSQLKILEAVTRKFNLAPTCDLSRVVESLSLRYTGADFYALASEALMHAYKEKASELHSQWNPAYGPLTAFLEDQDLTVEINSSHFVKAALAVTPSLSEEELGRYRSLNRTIEGS
eukprot:CAMPEP_0204898838 /NCGR_PEP_ID=MMETSP1397-20131031/1512_1 /ASSEMBLY_ACC=CAM_ASM_000891 /TAXON_ID=49980 /ORGANISM="Climacostomum Climacostomum virens, Strain Stock W-24" /LENGTH=707 /DNA_ID=CAMNT_0052066725 /DNA_START=174 /DNA_END=2297 /DNA_ORIENTATION=+